MTLNYKWEETSLFGYDYDVDYKEGMEAIYKIFAKEYSVPVEKAEQIVAEFDLYDECEEVFEEELKDYFGREAYEQYCADKDELY